MLDVRDQPATGRRPIVRAIILAAGVGRRLGLTDGLPKSLLRFGAETLLARHLRLLADISVTRVDVCVGYRAAAIAEELAGCDTASAVTTHYNPRYTRGPIVSLWTVREVLRGGEPVIFLDADVLYDHRMVNRLIAADAAGCFLLDRVLDPGDDPVKLCLRGGHLVDIHKVPDRAHDMAGEWVGIARFSPDVARDIAAAAARHVDAGALDGTYEEAFRDVLHVAPLGVFGVVDVSDLPWIEIDFPEDLQKARDEIFPRLVEASR